MTPKPTLVTLREVRQWEAKVYPNSDSGRLLATVRRLYDVLRNTHYGEPDDERCCPHCGRPLDVCDNRQEARLDDYICNGAEYRAVLAQMQEGTDGE